MENRKINFSDIASLFDLNIWDIGYLSSIHMDRAGSTPIKAKFHHHEGLDLTTHIHNTALNGIILFKYSEESNDYSLYEESFEILQKKYFNKFIPTYTNFKEAALLSGLGHRAKNSLVYNRKFGFQCKICVFMSIDQIINFEILNPSKDLLDLCNDCDDCIKNCPAQAIHDDWIDARKCDNFIGFGNHPNIPSIKWFWYDKMKPNISKDEVQKWSLFEEVSPFEWGHGVDGYYEMKGIYLYKDGEKISIPHCRECVCQPKCSKAPLYNS